MNVFDSISKIVKKRYKYVLLKCQPNIQNTPILQASHSNLTTIINIPPMSYKKRIGQDHSQTTIQNGQLQHYITSNKTIQILQKKGIKTLFPIQYLTYHTIFKGEDIIARDKTGSGKTMAFALPVIEKMRKERAFEQNHLAKFLIVLPTRELTIQVMDEIQSLRYRDQPDFRVVAVYGKSDINKQIQIIKRGIDIIVATPGRLIDLLQRDVIRMNELKVLCLDQADEMLKQGFKQQVQKIYKYIKDHAPGKTQNLLFSATVPDWLKDISRTYQTQECKYINLIKEDDLTTPKTLQHMCLKLSRQDQYNKAKIVSKLINRFANKSGNCIIFCQKKRDVDQLSTQLQRQGIKNQGLHGDVPQFKRQGAYRKFKSGMLKCIIATNVAARGLDFPHIDLVIQCQPPNNVQPYIHRSGRTARKGTDGICVTLYTSSNERYLNTIQRQAKINMKKLNVSDFSGGSSRHQRRDERDYQRRDQRRDDRRSQRRQQYKSNRHEDTEDQQLQLYFKYMPQSKDEEDIKKYFGNKGVEVRTVKLMKKQGGSKGCGFLKFGSRKDRDRCLQCDGHEFQGRHISVTMPQKR